MSYQFLFFISHEYNFSLIFQGILVDIHIQKWVQFLGMIDFSNAKKPEYVCQLLERKIPKDYWEQLNTTFGCLSQIIANNIIAESVVMGTLIGELTELKILSKRLINIIVKS